MEADSPSDHEEQFEPYRIYFFICKGANTETFYFRRLIDLRKQLGIHPLIDIRLWEKTEGDKNISFHKNLLGFAHIDPARDGKTYLARAYDYSCCQKGDEDLFY